MVTPFTGLGTISFDFKGKILVVLFCPLSSFSLVVFAYSLYMITADVSWQQDYTPLEFSLCMAIKSMVLNFSLLAQDLTASGNVFEVVLIQK